jgi:hypothetical protein
MFLGDGLFDFSVFQPFHSLHRVICIHIGHHPEVCLSLYLFKIAFGSPYQICVLCFLGLWVFGPVDDCDTQVCIGVGILGIVFVSYVI